MSRINISSLSSLVTGMNQGYRLVRDVQRDDEDRKFVSMQRARQEKQWRDADKLQGDIAMAADPAEVQPTMEKADTQDNRDVGQPGEAAPVQRGFNVKGQQFASMADAQGAAKAHNAPDAVTARMSTALLKAGKPVEAQQLRAGARQEKVADLQLSDMERTQVDKLYDQQLSSVDSFDALGTFLSNSKGDGRGGSLKVKAIGSPDGKSVTVHQVNADGSTTPTPYSFANDARGLTQAKLMLAKSASTADKLAHLHQQHVEGQQAKQLDATISHQSGMLKVAQQNANTQEQYRRDSLALQRERVDGAKKDPLAKMSEADRLTLGDLNKKAEFINQAITKARAEGSWRDGDPNAVALQKDLAALGLQARAVTSKYLKEDQSADPLGIRGNADAAPAPAAPLRQQTTSPDVLGPLASMRQAVPPQDKPPTPDPILATMTATAGTNSTLLSMAAERAAAVKAIGAEVVQAKAQLAAAAKSGDSAALNLYAQRLQGVRTKLNAAMAGLPDDQRQKLTGIVEAQ
jgi:hypothetical protein